MFLSSRFRESFDEAFTNIFGQEESADVLRVSAELRPRSSGLGLRCLVEGAVTEHREQDIAAAPDESDQCLVMSFTFRAFPVVICPRDGVAQRCERGEEQRPFQGFVALA